MINQFTLILFCVLCLLSCNSKKSVQQTNDTTNTRTMQDQPAFEVSTQTKRFQAELLKVTANSDLENLPEEFTKKYNLQKIDGQLYVQGFIQTNEDFKANSLSELGIKSGPTTGNMQTVSIPLDQFSQFLGISGIQYFQLSEAINSKK